MNPSITTREPDEALARNQRTVQSYEGCARAYAEATAPCPSGLGKEALQRLARVVEAGAHVLEIGSGPGWDADYVETLGVRVRRTDVTQAFRDVQAERGQRVEPLDVITDDLDGPYEGVMALCVLQHIDRSLTRPVLHKIAAALRPFGVFLVSIPEGAGEFIERGSDSGEYHVVLWKHDEFLAQLDTAGFQVEWHVRNDGDDGTWLTFLARKVS